MNLRIVRRARWRLYAVCSDRGECPLLDFLGERDRRSKEKLRMIARLQNMAEEGPPLNTSICHQIEDGIWQVEAGRIRVLWFYDEGRMIVLSHGFIKATQKTPEQEKRTARENLRRYKDAKRRNTIRVLEDRNELQG
jgi:phage-related protein